METLCKAQSDLVKIAGKTGTAQVMENGKYFNNKHILYRG